MSDEQEAKDAGFHSIEDYEKALDLEKTVSIVVMMGIILLLAFGISRI